MALWQYTFRIIPSVNLNELEKAIKDNTDGLRAIDDDSLWKKDKRSLSEFAEFGEILPLGKSWSGDVVLYGDLEKNCVELYMDGDSVSSLSFRIDFRSEYENILTKLIEIIKSKDLIILDENLSMIPQSFEAINQAIQSAPQVVKWKHLTEGD